MKFNFFVIIITLITLFSCQKKDYTELKAECFKDRFDICNELLMDSSAPKEVTDYGFDQMKIGCKAKYLLACQYLIKYYESANKDGKHDDDLVKSHRQSCKVGHQPSCDYFEQETGKRSLNIR